MVAAAVPQYVSNAAGNFANCPPGHRFNLYFPIWREGDWQLDKNGKLAALRQCTKLGSAAEPLRALRQRQQSLAQALPEAHCFVMEARSTAPFATGLGLEHPVENGFAFLTPYGLPYLAGSGVKGVLRSAAQELQRMDAEAQRTGDEAINLPVIETLFGSESDHNARRGAITCWDVFPSPPKDKDLLVVEIMTPHFPDYFQNKGTPHDAGKPNPIPFLAVAAGSEFRFVVTCVPALLNDAVPLDRWQHLLARILSHAFDWLGFGAKTSVGYGAMEEDPVAKKRLEEMRKTVHDAALKVQEQNEREQALSQLSPAMRVAQEFLDARIDKNQPELSAFLGGLKKGIWSGDTKSEIAQHVKQMMIKDKKWKEKSEKKNPAKDNDHQDTLLVMTCLSP